VGCPIRTSTDQRLARISPRLFAACHVLHRLLVPRHPPNALLSLRHGHPASLSRIAGPPARNETGFGSAAALSTGSAPGLHLTASPRPSGAARFPPAPAAQKEMETVGFEPTTPCLQSRCSPTELRPRGRGCQQLRPSRSTATLARHHTVTQEGTTLRAAESGGPGRT
jgi:hypothetical protein